MGEKNKIALKENKIMLLNKNGVKIIESDVKNGQLICMLLGAPGIGKSSIMMDIAKKNGWFFFQLLCNQIAMQADLTGCRTVEYERPDGTKDHKQVFFPHAVIKDAIDTALANPDKTVLLFLDEINRTSAAVTSAILTFITARTIGTEKLPDNIILAAAGNDDGNVISLDDASLSRFILRRCEPDAETFLGLGKIHPIIQDLLKAQPALIFQDHNVNVNEDDEEIYSDEDTEFKQIATPRTIMGFNKALLENSNMIMNMSEAELKEYVTGFTGNTLFTEAVTTAIIADKFKLVTAPKLEAPTKPDVVDVLLGLTKITDIQDFVANMTDDDISSCLVYMLYDQTTNYTNIVPELCRKFSKNMLLNGDMQKLNLIINSGEYNHDAYNAMISVSNTLTETCKMLFSV